MPTATPGLFTSPSRDTARAVLPRAEHTEQQPKLLLLQTIHFYSPKFSTSSVWQERDSWLKSNEEKPSGTEVPQLQPGARQGRGKVSPAESPAQQRSLPTCPFPFRHSPCVWLANGLLASTTEVPSNVLLCILSAKDYSCAK